MSYLYCQNTNCGEYLGGLGGKHCPICGWLEVNENLDDYETEESMTTEEKLAYAIATLESLAEFASPDQFFTMKRIILKALKKLEEEN